MLTLLSYRRETALQGAL